MLMTSAGRDAILVATLETAPAPGGGSLRTSGTGAHWLEIRADLMPNLDPDWLRRRFPRKLLYSLRSRAEGGAAESSPEGRKARLIEAASLYDLVDLEGERDLTPEILSLIPPERRVISWHAAAAGSRQFEEAFQRFSVVRALYYRLVSRPETPEDEIEPLAFLDALRRPDVIAYASGRGGWWTRLIAARLGAPLVFGAAAPSPGDESPTIEQLQDDYGLPALPDIDQLYGIVGARATASLSPRLHNAGMRALGRRALFVPFTTASMEGLWRSVLHSPRLAAMGLSVDGLTVASPHKESAARLAERSSDMVRRAGSSNVCVRQNGEWLAETTDPHGVLDTLGQCGVSAVSKNVAVVGCGGSGRAIAAALQCTGARVTLVNRGRERGELAVHMLGLPFIPLSKFSVSGFSIVVNATPVGSRPEELPFGVDELDAGAMVIDHVYGDAPTALMSRTRELGRVGVDGREILLSQVRRQFWLMNSLDLPMDEARETLGLAAREAAAPEGIRG